MYVKKTSLLSAAMLAGVLTTGAAASFAQTSSNDADMSTVPTAVSTQTNPDLTIPDTGVSPNFGPDAGRAYPATDIGHTPYTMGVSSGEIQNPSWTAESGGVNSGMAGISGYDNNSGMTCGSSNPLLMGPTTVTGTPPNPLSNGPMIVNPGSDFTGSSNSILMGATTATGTTTTNGSMTGSGMGTGTNGTAAPGPMSNYMWSDHNSGMLSDFVDYNALVHSPFTYYDLQTARAAGLTPSQIGRAAAIADISGRSMDDIVAQIQSGRTFPSIAADYNIPMSRLSDVSKYQDRVLNYVAAYEVTGKNRAMAMSGSNPAMERVSPSFEILDNTHNGSSSTGLNNGTNSSTTPSTGTSTNSTGSSSNTISPSQGTGSTGTTASP